MSLLEVNGLNAYYGDSHILFDVSLRVEKHEAVALVGRNGAGKSTTLKSLMGVVARRTGSIKLDGVELVGREGPQHRPSRHAARARGPAHLRQPQRRREHHPRRADRRRANGRSSAFTSMFPRLKERRTSRGTDLSGGEQQMLAIARALVRDPKIILLDEPFEGLAPIIVQDLVHTCRELARSGQTIVLVEQNLAAALALAERVYIINNGHIAHEGPAAEIKAQPDLLQRYLGV